MSSSHKRRKFVPSANTLFYAVALATAAATGSLFAVSSAQAQTGTNVQTTSEIKIERVQTDSSGRETRVLTSPETAPVVPGDTVVVINSYHNVGSEPATNFVSVNPINPNLAFVSVAEDWAEVSVDGGKTWGQLNQLTILADPPEQDEAGPPAASPPTLVRRSASAADVTHIRWRFPQAIAPGEKGKLSFRATVR
ncbi:MAG: hypothetical protein AAFX04_03030 [Pseudomonadota bacterium]